MIRRQPRGTPAGGQFTTTTRGESTVTLSPRQPEPEFAVEEQLRGRKPTPAELTARYGSHADAVAAYAPAQVSLGRAEGELVKAALHTTGPFGTGRLLKARAAYQDAHNAATDAWVARHVTAAAEGMDPSQLVDDSAAHRARGRDQVLKGAELTPAMVKSLERKAAKHLRASGTKTGAAESKHLNLAAAYSTAASLPG